MTQICTVCERTIVDGDEVIARMVAVFRGIPSEQVYALEHPTECLGLIHRACDEKIS